MKDFFNQVRSSDLLPGPAINSVAQVTAVKMIISRIDKNSTTIEALHKKILTSISEQQSSCILSMRAIFLRSVYIFVFP